MATSGARRDRVNTPLDLIEHIAAKHDWAMDRTSEDELTLTVAGQWSDYHVSINWRGDLETLHIASAFDAKIPENRLNEVYRLVAQINEQLWLGHFDIWSNGGVVLYRHGLMLGEDGLLGPGQAQLVVEAAIEECDRFYPVFQFILWGDKTPAEALAAAMVDAAGEA